ncbi:hypothetical protein BT69DRAFT_331091 [Atractiella rhizophila]|nr:hypothetical protein BT69DRAFT_331091 [Atractiella rhizophila]
MNGLDYNFGSSSAGIEVDFYDDFTISEFLPDPAGQNDASPSFIDPSILQQTVGGIGGLGGMDVHNLAGLASAAMKSQAPDHLSMVIDPALTVNPAYQSNQTYSLNQGYQPQKQAQNQQETYHRPPPPTIRQQHLTPGQRPTAGSARTTQQRSSPSLIAPNGNAARASTQLHAQSSTQAQARTNAVLPTLPQAQTERMEPKARVERPKTRAEMETQFKSQWDKIKAEIQPTNLQKAPTRQGVRLAKLLAPYLIPDDVMSKTEGEKPSAEKERPDCSAVPAEFRMQICLSLKDKAPKEFFSSWVNEAAARETIECWFNAAYIAHKYKGANPRPETLAMEKVLIPLLYVRFQVDTVLWTLVCTVVVMIMSEQVIDKTPYTFEHLKKSGDRLSTLAKNVKDLMRGATSPTVKKIAEGLHAKWLAVGKAAKMEKGTDESRKRPEPPTSNEGPSTKKARLSLEGSTGGASRLPLPKSNALAFLDSKKQSLPSITKIKQPAPPPAPAIDAFTAALANVASSHKNVGVLPPLSTAMSSSTNRKSKKKSVSFAEGDSLVQIKIVERVVYDEDEEMNIHHSMSEARTMDISEGHAMRHHAEELEIQEEIDWFEPSEIELTSEDNEELKSLEAPLQLEREKITEAVVYLTDEDVPFSPNEPASIPIISDVQFIMTLGQTLKSDPMVEAEISRAQTAASNPILPADASQLSSLLSQLGGPASVPFQAPASNPFDIAAQLSTVNSQDLLAALASFTAPPASQSTPAHATNATWPTSKSTSSWDGPEPSVDYSLPDHNEVIGGKRKRIFERGARGRAPPSKRRQPQKQDDVDLETLKIRKSMSCKYFMTGDCRWGDDCHYSHDHTRFA